MSIKVESTSIQPVEKPVEENVESTPAPEVKTSEQNEAQVSETEGKEETDELEAKLDSEESDDAEDSDKPKKKGGFQRRIDKLNARNAAAQAEIDHWKAVALKSAGEPRPIETVETKAPEGKPNAENFDTHSEYVEALTDWKTEQKFKEREQEAANNSFKSEQEKLFNAYNERVKSFSKKVDDYQDVIESVDDIPVPSTIQGIIISSENGAELSYELAKNREEFKRICALPPLAAAYEIGLIASKISPKSSEENKPEPKKITKAPQPIAPVGSKGGSIKKDINDPNLSQAEYEKLRNEQRRSA